MLAQGNLTITHARNDCGAWCATNELTDGRRIIVPLTCRSWDCLSCARYLKKRLLHRLRYAKPNLFITLTTSTRTAADPRAAFDAAAAAWPKLIQRWRRRFPHDQLEYFFVWERTKAGWPHIHALIRGPAVSKHWLSRTWRQLTGSYIIDVQKIGSIEHAGTYLAKYLAKDPQVPEKQRRWRRSAAFFNVADEPRPDRLAVIGKWTRQPRPALAQAWFDFNAGYALTFGLDDIVHAVRDPVLHEQQLKSGVYHRLHRQVAHLLPYLPTPDEYRG